MLQQNVQLQNLQQVILIKIITWSHIRLKYRSANKGTNSVENQTALVRSLLLQDKRGGSGRLAIPFWIRIMHMQQWRDVTRWPRRARAHTMPKASQLIFVWPFRELWIFSMTSNTWRHTRSAIWLDRQDLSERIQNGIGSLPDAPRVYPERTKRCELQNAHDVTIWMFEQPDRLHSTVH